MSNKKWECEIIAPPELHKPIQELFDAISWKLKHAESSSAQFATDINVGDTVSRQAAIKAFDDAGFCTHGYIVDVLDGLPSSQPEEVIPHRNYKYLSDYWCECGWHLGKKGEVKYCSECGRKVNWGE